MSKYITFTTPSIFYEYKTDNALGEKLNTKHCHDSYELLFVTKGEGRFLVEGTQFEMRPNTLVIIRPFEYHCVEISECNDYERHVFHFSPTGLTSQVQEIFNKLVCASEEDSGIFYTSENVTIPAIATFDNFKYVPDMPDKDKDLYANLLLSQLIFLLSASQNQVISHDEFELGARVAKYINDFIDKNNNLDFLAKRFFVSKYYLCHSFKKYSGVSIHSYINHKRVMYAKQLIDKGETASRAAYKVGFGDYSAFYRAYVKILGIPPTADSKKRQVKSKLGFEEEKYEL